MKRAHNEDSYCILQEQNLFLVADGMGGHASGEVASGIAVETVAEFFRQTAEDDNITWPYKMDKDRSYAENRLINSIKLANLRIYEAATVDPRMKGMGTTIVGFHVVDSECLLGHVGDSRIYHIEGEGEIKQLTEDHSLLNDYIKMKNLTPEEIEQFPHKNVIVRALGMKETVAVDSLRVSPKEGDFLLLCSDGLSGMIDDENLMRITLEHRDDLEKACAALIEEANDAGGTDNITVLIARIDEVNSA